MKLFIPEKKFYVYTHKINCDVFYVGKGQGARCLDSLNRSKFYHLFLQLNDKDITDVEVDVVKWFDDEEDALSCESDLIAHYKSMGNNMANILGYLTNDVDEAIMISRNITRDTLININITKFKKDCVNFIENIKNEDDCVKDKILEFIKLWDNENDFSKVVFHCDGKVRCHTDMKKNGYAIGKNKINKIFNKINIKYKIISERVFINGKQDTIWKIVDEL